MRLGSTPASGAYRIPRMDPLGPSTAFKVRGATRGQGRTHGDQRTWWRGLRIAERRKTATLRLIVQVAGVPGPWDRRRRRMRFNLTNASRLPAPKMKPAPTWKGSDYIRLLLRSFAASPKRYEPPSPSRTPLAGFLGHVGSSRGVLGPPGTPHSWPELAIACNHCSFADSDFDRCASRQLPYNAHSRLRR